MSQAQLVPQLKTYEPPVMEGFHFALLQQMPGSTLPVRIPLPKADFTLMQQPQ
jgi:hypothetical protein